MIFSRTGVLLCVCVWVQSRVVSFLLKNWKAGNFVVDIFPQNVILSERFAHKSSPFWFKFVQYLESKCIRMCSVCICYCETSRGSPKFEEVPNWLFRPAVIFIFAPSIFTIVLVLRSIKGRSQDLQALNREFRRVSCLRIGTSLHRTSCPYNVNIEFT